MAPTPSPSFKALGLKQVDLFGFSIGGMVVQEITLQAPDLVRRLIVDGAGRAAVKGMELIAQATGRLLVPPPRSAEECLARVKFQSVRPARRGTGVPEAQRIFRKRAAIPKCTTRCRRPGEAIGKWGVQQKGSYDYLKTIKHQHSS